MSHRADDYLKAESAAQHQTGVSLDAHLVEKPSAFGCGVGKAIAFAYTENQIGFARTLCLATAMTGSAYAAKSKD